MARNGEWGTSCTKTTQDSLPLSPPISLFHSSIL